MLPSITARQADHFRSQSGRWIRLRREASPLLGPLLGLGGLLLVLGGLLLAVGRAWERSRRLRQSE